MRTFLYGLGVVLVLLGGATAVADVLAFMALGAEERLSLALLWERLHPSSRLAFEALVVDLLGHGVWEAVLWLLRIPAWISLTLPGLVLVLLYRPRRSRFDF